MLQSIKNRLRPLYHSLFDNDRHQYVLEREVTMKAPYPVSIYEDMMNMLKGDNSVNFLPFNTPPSKGDRVNFYARHDIDTLKCVENMPFMLDINLKTKTDAAVYFRVDDDEYRLQDIKELANEYRSKGFEMGLHTNAWQDDDYMESFARETEKFSDEVGFVPKSFTVHGMGAYRQDVKAKFNKEVAQRWDEYGYEATDCHPRFRRYHYVIEDCHWNEAEKSRFIYEDFVHLPEFIKGGKNYIILTHPCYWEQ